MHSTTVSKKLLGLGPVVAVRFGQRQIAVFLWTEPARFAVPMISIVATKRNCRLYDTVNAQMTWPTPALCASGACYSSGKRLLVVIGENLDIKRCADSTLRVPADGAGGLRLR